LYSDTHSNTEIASHCARETTATRDSNTDDSKAVFTLRTTSYDIVRCRAQCEHRLTDANNNRKHKNIGHNLYSNEFNSCV